MSTFFPGTYLIFHQQNLHSLNIGGNEFINITFDQGKIDALSMEINLNCNWQLCFFYICNIYNEAKKKNQVFQDNFFHSGLLQQLTNLNISGCYLKAVEIEVKSAAAPQSQRLSIDLSNNHLRTLPTNFMRYVTENLVTLTIKGNLIPVFIRTLYLFTYRVQMKYLSEIK